MADTNQPLESALRVGGALVNLLFVRRDIERIFAFRTEALRHRFGGK